MKQASCENKQAAANLCNSKNRTPRLEYATDYVVFLCVHCVNSASVWLATVTLTLTLTVKAKVHV